MKLGMGTTDKRLGRTSKINTWKPKKSELFVKPDGKLFTCAFDAVFENPRFKPYNKFMINKGSYENQLDIITRYINFFISHYDKEQELLSAYLKIKYALDKKHRYDKDNMDAYIDFIYAIMFTPTMVQKIHDLVEDNYLDDIEKETEEKKKYVKSEKKHLESLEFTNVHIKALLRISFGMKIMSPVLFHYLALNVIKIEKNSDIIFRFYQHLFDIFGYGDTYDLHTPSGDIITAEIEPEIVENLYEKGEVEKLDCDCETYYYFPDRTYYTKTKINMFNKLYVYVKAKVLESNSNNALIFEQRAIFGIDVYSVINQFTKKVIISENMVKYKFNEHWDPKQKKYKESVIGFNKTIIKFQMNYFIKEQYQKTLTEVTNIKNSDGLSGIDKLIMNLNKIDEGKVTLADINIEQTLNNLMEQIDVPISDEEINYYMEHLKPCPIQQRLVYSYYAKYFGSYRDLNLLPLRSYIILVILLKKKLLLENGIENPDKVYCAVLPYILTGNLEDKVNNRIIRNTKFIAKVEESYLYQNLISSEKYGYLQAFKPDYILSLLSTLINTRFSYVTYENPELLGEEILYSEDRISDELLFFLNEI